jgi:hypothetical protein
MPDSSWYGSQTVTGPGWPNVEEETLAAAAASYEALAAKITGSVVPQQQSQMMHLSDTWKGGGATAAMAEATTIIAGHEINAAQATAIAVKLRAMEATVVKTKMLVNATAMETQAECEAIQMVPGQGTQAALQSRIMLGLSQNIADVNANTAELAGTLEVAPNVPNPGAPPVVGAQQAASEASKQGQDGSQQAMQMLGQLGQMASQLPQMLMQIPQQMMQQVTQPLQQLTSMFGAGGKGSESAGAVPFRAFSNHPLAGGSGAGGGSGLVRAASLPGSGGVNSQTPLMATLVGNHAADVAVHPAMASSGAVGGVAPIGAGMAPMGMMGGRGDGGGTAASLAIPAPLDHDLGDGDVDDDW